MFIVTILILLLAIWLYRVSVEKIMDYFLPRIYKAYDGSHYNNKEGLISDLKYVWFTVGMVLVLLVHLITCVSISVFIETILQQEILGLAWTIFVTLFFSVLILYTLLSARIKRMRFYING